MVEAVSASASAAGYTPAGDEENVGAAGAPTRSSVAAAVGGGDRVTLSSRAGAGVVAAYDARGHLGGVDQTAATESLNAPPPAAGVAAASEDATVEYQTSLWSLFALPPNGPSALPVRPGMVYIGTPPLVRAIDLLRSMMIAFSQSRSLAVEAPAPSRGSEAPSRGAMAASQRHVVEP